MVLVVAITAGDDFYFVGFFSDVSVIFARLVGDSDVYNNLLLGLWLILRIYLCYYYSTFIITNWRIVDVDQSGFFNQTVSESLYSQIEEVTFKCRGLLRAVMSLGDIYISFIDSKRIKIKLPLIKNPQHIVDEVLSQQELSIKDRAGIDQNAQILLKKIKSRLSKQEFNQLITD